jgi:hypothetical protein
MSIRMAVAARSSGLPDQLVVFGMCSDPKPDKSVRCFDGERSVSASHASRPEATYLLQPNGRIVWILPQMVIRLVGKPLDALR